MLLLTLNSANETLLFPDTGPGETLYVTEKKIYLLTTIARPILNHLVLKMISWRDSRKTLLTISLEIPRFKEFVEIERSLTVESTSVC